MHDIPDDELISAYLDGEVTDEERRHVERLLAERPECRKLFEELQAITGQLRAAPRHELDDRFARRVLRRAERHMLAGEPSNAVPNDATAPAEAPSVASPSSESPLTSATISIASARTLKGHNWRRYGWAGLAAAAALLVMFLSGPEPDADNPQVANAPQAGPESLSLDTPRGELPNIGAPSNSSPAEGGPVSPLIATTAPDEQAVDPSSPSTAPDPTRTTAPIESTASTATGTTPASERADLATDSDSQSTEPSSAVAGGSNQPAAPDDVEPAVATTTAPSSSPPFELAMPRPELKGDELVVVVEVAQQAFDEQMLDRLLESVGIHFDDESRPASESSDVIYVEATPTQVEAALRGLAGQPNRFLKLAVVPADDAERGAAWLQYERGDVSIPAPSATGRENNANYMRELALGAVAERRARATEAVRQSEELASAERAAQSALGPDGKPVPRLARAAQSARPAKPEPAARSLPAALEKAARRVSRARRFGSSQPSADISPTDDSARSPSASDLRRAEMIEQAQQRAVFLVRVAPATAP